MKSRHALADRGDGAGDFGAENKRQVVRIEPGPEVRVDEIHADRFGLDQHLAGPGGGLRPLDEGKDVRSAGFPTSIAYMFNHSNATCDHCRWIRYKATGHRAVPVHNLSAAGGESWLSP